MVLRDTATVMMQHLTLVGLHPPDSHRCVPLVQHQTTVIAACRTSPKQPAQVVRLRRSSVGRPGGGG